MPARSSAQLRARSPSPTPTVPLALALALLSGVALAACSSRGSPTAGASSSVATRAASVATATRSAAPELSAPGLASATPSASAPAVAPSSTPNARGPIATLLEEAKLDHARHDHEKIAVDGVYVKTSTRRWGTGEHPHYASGVLWIADSKDDLDHQLPCAVANGWPPVGLELYEPIRVEGVGSMSEWVSGGDGPPGDKLKLVGCVVTRKK